MKTHASIKKLLLPGAVLGVLGLAANPALAVTNIYLAAKQFDMTMPDETTVPMWGFAPDPDGTCYTTTPTAARLTCAEGLTATVPGPRLTAPVGDPNVRIFITNTLPEPISLVIPGQEMPHSNTAGGATNFGPTWDTGSDGPRPGPTARVRSFGKEAAPNGGRNAYRWVTGQGTPLQPGTYLYQSGTHPQVQVQMGLYGAITADVAAGEAYPGITYVAGRDLFFSEVDPDLHGAVAAGPFSGSTLDYNPKYFLLNSYDPGTGEVVDVSIDTGTIPPLCIDTGASASDALLLRMYNAGLRELAPMLIGSHFDLVAEGGKPYPFPRTQYQTLLMPGSTKDAVFTPGYDGDFKLIERRLNTTDPGVTGSVNGGMQTCFTVGAAGGLNQPPNVSNPGDQTNTVDDSVSLQIAASDPDAGDTLSYSAVNLPAGLTIDPGTGLISDTVTTVQPATLVTVTVADDGTPAASAFVEFNWTVNAANQAPDVTNPGAQTNVQGDEVSLQIDASDPNTGDTLDFSATNLPTNLAIDTVTGVISGTVTDVSGDFAVTVTVTDDAVPPLETSVAFAWTIGNRLPAVTNPGGQTSPTGLAITPLQIVASDPDTGDTLSYSAVNLPAGLTIDAGTGVISGTVTAIPATFTVVVTVTDSGTPAQSAEVTFDWTIVGALYFSTGGNVQIPGVSGTPDDADIYLWNGSSFSRVFDGSAAGLGGGGSSDIDALFVVDADTFYMSFLGTVNPPGPLGNVDDSDIVLYDAGVWSLYFDGSDVGLTTGNEDVKAFYILPDGSVVISTLGTGNVPGVGGFADEDLLRCVGTFGPTTTCTWSLYLDGSDIDETFAGENIDAVAVAANGDIYLSTTDGFAVEGLSGADEDVFVCTGPTTGTTSACTSFEMFFDGSVQGVGDDLDAISLP